MVHPSCHRVETQCAAIRAWVGAGVATDRERGLLGAAALMPAEVVDDLQ